MQVDGSHLSQETLPVVAFTTMPIGTICFLYWQPSTNRAIVAVDGHFMMMPRLAQAAMLFHEMGHVKCNHFLNRNTDDIHHNEREELEADQNAVNELGVDAFLEGVRQCVKYCQQVPELRQAILGFKKKIEHWSKSKMNGGDANGV
jgi:hypothetical protein